MEKKKHSQTKNLLAEQLDKLENIVQELNESNQPIEYLIDKYEEGLKLAQETKQYLTQLEGRLININEKQNL